MWLARRSREVILIQENRYIDILGYVFDFLLFLGSQHNYVWKEVIAFSGGHLLSLQPFAATLK